MHVIELFTSVLWLLLLCAEFNTAYGSQIVNTYFIIDHKTNIVHPLNNSYDYFNLNFSFTINFPCNLALPLSQNRS